MNVVHVCVCYEIIFDGVRPAWNRLSAQLGPWHDGFLEVGRKRTWRWKDMCNNLPCTKCIPINEPSQVSSSEQPRRRQQGKQNVKPLQNNQLHQVQHRPHCIIQCCSPASHSDCLFTELWVSRRTTPSRPSLLDPFGFLKKRQILWSDQIANQDDSSTSDKQVVRSPRLLFLQLG